MREPVRRAVRRGLEAIIERRCRWLSDEELCRPAVVVAPHPDDETLGCGGTILRMRRLGADVQVAVMTDGGGSHPGFMSPGALAAIRRGELARAAAALGLAASGTTWLGLPDGALAAHAAAAERSLAEVVAGTGVDRMIVPLADGEHPDHVAAHHIALRVARRSGRAMTLLEYPVWFWRRWPWVRPDRSGARAAARAIAGAAHGLAVLATLDAGVDVRAVLADKRRALDAHASQTTRLLPTPAWFTLGDVCGGDFLSLFFRGHELFRTRRVPAGS